MRRFLISPLFFVLLAVLPGCSISGSCVVPQHEPGVDVYIVSNGFHTGVAVPAEAIAAADLPEAADFPQAKFLEIGWGDQAYYMAPRASLWLGSRALLWPTSSVLQVTATPNHPRTFFPGAVIERVHLQPELAVRLVKQISITFDRNGRRKAQPLGPGYYPHSLFYAAHGSFSALRTCNTWVARVLKETGCPIAAPLPVTASSLLSQVASFSTTESEKSG